MFLPEKVTPLIGPLEGIVDEIGDITTSGLSNTDREAFVKFLHVAHRNLAGTRTRTTVEPLPTRVLFTNREIAARRESLCGNAEAANSPWSFVASLIRGGLRLTDHTVTTTHAQNLTCDVSGNFVGRQK